MPGSRSSQARAPFSKGKAEANTAAASAYGTLDESSAAAAVEAGAWLRKTAHWLENSDDTDPTKVLARCCECEDDFRARRLKAPMVLAWLVLQIMGMLFQGSMISEIAGHLELYEATIAANCGPEHLREDVCLGPSWNLTQSQVIEFSPTMPGGEDDRDFDFVIPSDHTVSFQTRSDPPTYLIGIEPLPPHELAGWTLSLAQQDSHVPLPSISGHGRRYRVMTKIGPCHKLEAGGFCKWRGSLVLTSKYISDTVSVHLYVVDSKIQHLEEIHKQPQCSFEQSWQNFSERKNGSHHHVLTAVWHGAVFFLLVSLLCTGLMLRRFLFFVEGGKLLSRLIVVKFLVQDVPQQLYIAAYLYAWYAQNGLRCQMCLFHPAHCDDQYPLHFTNFMLCFFTLLSASSNQILIQMKSKTRYDEEEEIFQCCSRFALLSLSTLPFSTATLVLSNSVLQLHSPLVFMVAGLPAVFGWSSCLCLPMAAACDDDF